MCSCSVVVITCALHLQCLQFDPGEDNLVLFLTPSHNSVTFRDIMLGSAARFL